MKKRYLFTLAGFVLGAACALVQGVTGADILITLIKPFTALGNLLRSWSLSGERGNAGAWAVLTVLSLLPILYILIARRKRKQVGDWLFVLTGAGIFGGLFLLMNPTLYVHPMMTEALSYSPEVLTGGPVFAMISMLLFSIITRWSSRLMQLKSRDKRLFFWTQALLVGSMTLIAFSTAFSAAEGVQSVWGEGGASLDGWMVYEEAGDILPATDPFIQSLFPASGELQDTSALIGLLLTLIALIPDLFSIYMLAAAVSLVSSMGRGFFSDETDKCASKLAERARYTLIASIGCMAAENILTVALAQWIMNWNMSFSLPLDEMLISCGAMLLARLFSAACRVKRDNDLMI